MKIQFKSYVHSSKESNRDQLSELEGEFGVTFCKEATEAFIYNNYEVCLTQEIDSETGEIVTLEIDGKEIK